jgi:hypothetical protein
LIEFRLLYSGELLGASRTNTRAHMKHEIRRAFHPQLHRLWTMNHNLRQLAAHQTLLPEFAAALNRGPTEQERVEFGLRTIGRNWIRGTYECVPLITSDLALRCNLDILFLRQEEDRFVFTRGDIDAKLKTLFDALRIPKDLKETGNSSPQSDEVPFFCLLEDDSLISEVHINTDQLLLLPNEKTVKANDSFVMVHVKANNKTSRTFDNYFGD